MLVLVLLLRLSVLLKGHTGVHGEAAYCCCVYVVIRIVVVLLLIIKYSKEPGGAAADVCAAHILICSAIRLGQLGVLPKGKRKLGLVEERVSEYLLVLY